MKDKKYHLIGIKGSGMSALAQIMYDMGLYVQGSDVETYYFTQLPLEKKNIPMYVFDEKNITEDLTIILGNAFDENHIEYKKAKELGLKVYEYPEFVEYLLTKATSVAVTGAHGKTTTTTMTSTIFKHNRKTSYLIGDGTGASISNPEYFLLEACEYYRHFLEYTPDYAIVTNVDFDHPDYFKDEDDVLDAFQSFVDKVKKVVVYCGDDPLASKLRPKKAKRISYGFNDRNDYQIKNIVTTSKDSTFDIFYEGEKKGTFTLPVYGLHDISNATASIIVAYLNGLTNEEITESFKHYKNPARRFNEYEYINNNVVVDDYAHHPREIRATINTARRKYPNKDVVAIFQPHTYTRTKAFLDEFSESLQVADKIYLYPIFGSVREKRGNVTIDDLKNSIVGSDIIESADDLDKLDSIKDSVILFMGAGDINKVCYKFLEKIKASSCK